LDHELFNEIEEDAHLVFEHQGSWFSTLHPSLQKAFGMFGNSANGYVICLASELLRFSRNVLFHGSENEDLMEEVLGARHIVTSTC
jgi:hypothetical protein